MRHVPGVRLVVAGNDEENYLPVLEQLAREQGVRERIDFVGPVSGTRKAELLRNAAALALPSYSENFGIVVLEAMAAGCPVAVTQEVGAAEIVVESGGGVVLPGAPDKLGAGLANLLNDHRLREMGVRGRIRSTWYTWDVIGADRKAV
jgi:glycosyltransferase involved in cell wall biosynthesis